MPAVEPVVLLALERALASALNAALRRPEAEREACLLQHLLAQANGMPAPASAPAGGEGIKPESLQVYEERLSVALNVALQQSVDPREVLRSIAPTSDGHAL